MTSIAQSFAAMYWGFVFSTALVGISIVQGYMYFTNNSRDPWTVKSLVVLLLILDPLDSLLMGQALYYYFLVNFGNTNALSLVPLSWCIETFLTAFVTCVTQLYFATRLYKIYKQSLILPRYNATWLVPGAVAFFAIFGLVSGIVRTIWLSMWTAERFSASPVRIDFGAEEGCAVVSDLITTTALCHVLSPAHTGALRRGSSRIKNLSIFLLNRGILVTCIQLGMLITFLSAPTHLYWMPFHLFKSKLYTNTLLAMLNSRESDRAWLNTPHLEPVFNLTINNINSDATVSSADGVSTNAEKDNTPEIIMVQNRTVAKEGDQSGIV